MSAMTISTHSPRRSRMVAALLTLIAPGVGHIYAGRQRRGLIVTVASLLILPLTVAAPFLVPPSFNAIAVFGVVVLALFVVFCLWMLIDSARLAGRDDATPRVRWYVLLGAVVAVWAGYYATTLLFPVITQQLPWRTFSVASTSMQPTLTIGERLFADTLYYKSHAPARHDVVVYRLPQDNKTIYIKRVIALPGERVAFRENRAIVNGVATAEPFADFGDGKAFYGTTAEFTVPAGHVFVAGDNRSNSSDSRVKQHGPVPLENLVGRATEIFTTDDVERAGLWVGSPK